MVKKSKGLLKVFAWSPEDAVELLQMYTKDHPDVKGTQLIIDFNMYTELWGVPETSRWSQQAWASLLQVLPDRGKETELYIVVASTVPLTGLLVCTPPIYLQQVRNITVRGGTADLHTTREYEGRCRRAGVMAKLPDVTFVWPNGEEKDLSYHSESSSFTDNLVSRPCKFDETTY